MTNRYAEDKEALMIQDASGETVISFVEVDENQARLAIVTFDGVVFMLLPSQIVAIQEKLSKIMRKEQLQ